MSNRPKARSSYLWEKLFKAIDSGLFTSDPRVMLHSFHEVSRGLDDAKGAWYLQDEDAKQNAATIKRLIAPSEADGASPEGGWHARAERMTFEERSELATAMISLYTHLMDVDHDGHRS